MKKLCVTPLEGFNNIRFGTNRDDVRNTLNLEFREFRKTKYSKNTTDDYGVFHLYYDMKNKLEAIEIVGEIDVDIMGGKVFPGNINQLKNLITDLRQDGNYYESNIFSIGVVANDNEIESILFGKVGYYCNYIDGYDEKNRLLELKKVCNDQLSTLNYKRNNNLFNEALGKEKCAEMIKFYDSLLKVIKRQLEKDHSISE